MGSASKLRSRTSSGSTNRSVGRPPVSLSVQRERRPDFTSYEYTSAAARAEVKLKANSRPFSCHVTDDGIPSGRRGERSSFPERTSSK